MRDFVNNSCTSITFPISLGWPVAGECQGKVSFRQVFVFVFSFHLSYFRLEEPVSCNPVACAPVEKIFNISFSENEYTWKEELSEVAVTEEDCISTAYSLYSNLQSLLLFWEFKKIKLLNKCASSGGSTVFGRLGQILMLLISDWCTFLFLTVKIETVTSLY